LFGTLKIGVVGGVISAVSIASCAFVTDLRYYFLTYGVVFSIGQAMQIVASLGITTHYFKKKLSFANGILNLIAAIMVTVLPLVMNILIKQNLDYCFYFLGSANLLGAVLSFSFINQLPKRKKINLKTQIKQSFGLDIFKKWKYNVWLLANVIGEIKFIYNTDLI
jgi:MFS family permease